MKIDKAIKLMKSLDNISIEIVDDNRYFVRVKEYNDDYKPVICIIDGEDVEYHLDNLYNNSSNVEEIDFDQLNVLLNFVKTLHGIGD